ncbi:MAG: demethylmenaquinone methyltransferase [Micrococcaceae bacterium]
MSSASLDKKPSEVSSMFDGVAEKYDVTNDILSFGQDRVWRKKVVNTLNMKAGQKLLDLAAGTGVSSEPFAAAGVDVTACDFSPGMIAVGKKQRPNINFVEGDAMDLPFKDNVFDAATISFGLRNVQDPKKALSEMLRVTKPGGMLVVCEFSHPNVPIFSSFYKEYLLRALPAIARSVSSNPEAYIYLAETIQAWPDQAELATWIKNSGWVKVTYKNLSGGIVAIHRAYKPVKD